MKQYFLYLRENNHPVACLAIKADGPDSAYQVSTWSKKDRFDKTVARNVAEGRLVKNPIPVDLADSNFHETARKIVRAVVENSELPNRARSAAKKFLKIDAAEKALADARVAQ
jgi:hypothetical protein